jgi:hypothetical protein
LQVGAKAGMQTLEAALADLVAKRLVALEEARSKLPGSELLASMAQAGPR